MSQRAENVNNSGNDGWIKATTSARPLSFPASREVSHDEAI